MTAQEILCALANANVSPHNLAFIAEAFQAEYERGLSDAAKVVEKFDPLNFQPHVQSTLQELIKRIQGLTKSERSQE